MAKQEEMKTVVEANHRHPLVSGKSKKPFTCELCKCEGWGKRYRCMECDVDLHEICTACPETLDFFMHPEHTLRLEKSRNPFSHHRCGVCDDKIYGHHYRCKPCGFDVHPICSMVAPTITDASHPKHDLRYTDRTFVCPCDVCGENCEGWRYYCVFCGVDIHMRCLQVVSKENNNDEPVVDDGKEGGSPKEGSGDGKNRWTSKNAMKAYAVGFGVVLGVVVAALGDQEVEFDWGGDEGEEDFEFDMEGEEVEEFEVEGEGEGTEVAEFEVEEQEGEGQNGEEETKEDDQKKYKMVGKVAKLLKKVHLKKGEKEEEEDEDDKGKKGKGKKREIS